MELKRRIWVGAATTALALSIAAGTSDADRSRTRRAGPAARARAGKQKAAKAKAPGRAVVRNADSDEPLATRLHAAWVLYESLADWQLRSDVDPSTYSGARRALSVALAMVTARPGAAFEAALMQEPSVLEQRPVAGGVTSGFGVRRDPFRHKAKKKHNGLDLRAGRGVPVHAAGSGLVAKAERMRGYGRVVFVDHGEGVETRYAHLQRITVRAGQFVAPGDLVGKVGSSGHATGPHLHFEVRLDGRPVAPVEILGLVGADTPLAAWLQDLPRRMAEAAAAEAAPPEAAPPPEVKPAKKARGKRDRARRGLRSRRPTS
jgi:murein DD-endopeptidase MepM/ murein hydrolase activator NlpD